jgi:CubicO group peptidase (beta-lactamase class C family)
MLLDQSGRLKLSDQAFPLLNLTMPFGETSPLDSRLNSITVHQLLCHTGMVAEYWKKSVRDMDRVRPDVLSGADRKKSRRCFSGKPN